MQFCFEGWFDNSNDFNKQKKNKLINCPSCNSPNVKKGLMAPNLNKKSNSITTKIKICNEYFQIKKIIEKDFEYVGDKFTDEAKNKVW